jgi:hypothetical protein
MDEINQHARVLADKQVQRKIEKAIALGINKNTTEELLLPIIEELCKVKAELDGSDWKIHAKGQSWYANDIVRFMSQSVPEMRAEAYKEVFPDVATEEEMGNSLELLMAQAG